ncbi:radical SAM protein [Candidatus Dependentiae bacterium]|nr:radical SAM protein [Candidatus Dependentiae bacterium]
MNIDGHKLHYHPQRVSEWLTDELKTYPLYLEISPSNACNHSCIFCALDFCRNDKKNFLDTERALTLLDELSECGIKSILYAGAGEPFIHRDITKIINYTAKKNIDVAVNTNMALFTPEKIKECLHSLTWMRVSIDAGTSETYGSIHISQKNDFYDVIKNIEFAVKQKKDKRLKVTIGSQFLLLDKNKDEVVKTSKLLKKLGVDYFSIKPFNMHKSSLQNCSTSEITPELIEELDSQLSVLNSNSFKVVFRKDTFYNLFFSKRKYHKCYGLSFISFLREDGEIYPCLSVFGNKIYSYGNVYSNSFKEIWNGKTRKNVIELINNDFELMNKNNCRPTCRLDNINKYLWQLKNPDSHQNFI